MDFREWQAEYHPTLADIKVRAHKAALGFTSDGAVIPWDDLARARQVAREVWDNLSARPKNGWYGWKSISRIYPDPRTPCDGNDATCIWHGNHAALGRYLDAVTAPCAGLYDCHCRQCSS